MRLIIDAQLCDLRNRNIYREPQEVLLPILLQRIEIRHNGNDRLG